MKVYGAYYHYGNDPDDHGWSFDDGISISAGELADCDSWFELEALVPEDLIDKAKAERCRPKKFANFLKRHPEWFRGTEQSTELVE